MADALLAIGRCQHYVAALDGGTDLVEMAEDAIECNLQIIGEAVNHLREEIMGRHPEVPWPQIGASATSSSITTSESTRTLSAMSKKTHLPPLADALRSHIADD